LKRINLENGNQRENKQTKNDLQGSFVKIGGFSSNLGNGQMDSLLSMNFYLNLSTLKMYEIQQITSAGAKMAFKAKSIPAVGGYFRI
jgi:hypothetical protein